MRKQREDERQHNSDHEARRAQDERHPVDLRVVLLDHAHDQPEPAIQSISDNRRMKENLVVTLVDVMKIATVALVGFAGAIYFGSILTTSLVAIAERRREVATLMVMGYEKRQVGGIFLRESLLVNLKENTTTKVLVDDLDANPHIGEHLFSTFRLSLQR